MTEHNGLRHFATSAVRSFRLWPLVSKTGLYSFYRRRKYKDSLISLDVVITECCTLRCRNCANLMQYYHHPENTDADEMIFSMRKLFSAFMVKQLNILGGEPFVCQKNLVRILEYLNEEAVDRYGEVVIITNGTIIPSEECLNIMKTTPRLKVLFSNYGELSSKLEEFTGICKRMGIACDVVDTEFWWDFGDLSQRVENERQTQRRYDACFSRRHCTTLYRGKLYVCPRQAHAIRLGVILENSSETVCFSDPEYEEPKALYDAVYRLIDRKNRISACARCGCDCDVKIPRAVQTERPLDVT